MKIVPHIERIKIELAELNLKIHSLDEFFASEIYSTLDDLYRDELSLQSRHMRLYASVLHDRLK